MLKNSVIDDDEDIIEDEDIEIIMRNERSTGPS